MIDKDLQETAGVLAVKLGEDIDPYEIALALQTERNANRNEIAAWRTKYRDASWGEDCGAAIADMVRKWTKELTGTNATWVDDDLKILTSLADIAISSNLYGGLPKTWRDSIDELKEKRRNFHDPDTEAGGPG